MRSSLDDMQVTANYMAVQMLPTRFREGYVRDISVKYSGEAITYILQALSSGFTSVCLGIIGNYLYDKAKKRSKRKKRPDMRADLAEYESQIEELREYLGGRKRSAKALREALRFHEETLLKIRERDPEIQSYVVDALEQLESKGRDKLEKKVSSYWKRR